MCAFVLGPLVNKANVDIYITSTYNSTSVYCTWQSYTVIDVINILIINQAVAIKGCQRCATANSDRVLSEICLQFS